MRVAVLVSGGVDSSVALLRLKEAGHDLHAFYLKVWLEDELDFLGQCPWEEDIEFARGVCAALDVPLDIIPLQQAYRERIISYTLDELRAGRTPNPDVLCNNRVKFGAFFESVGNEYERIATGHYAWLEEREGLARLMRAPDPIKDQTYFLSHLGQEQLRRALFPIGDLTKEQVRALAADHRLPTMSRKDSQGLCFLGKISFRDFIAHHMGRSAGPFIEWETGATVGEHDGSWFFTIGQRKGLGLSGGPWYVVSKEVDTNAVHISRQYHSPHLARDRFWMEGSSWTTGRAPGDGAYLVKVRHGPEFHEATVSSEGPDRWRVELAERDQGLAAGQFAVLYAGRECLGSAVIVEAPPGTGEPANELHRTTSR